MTFSMEVEPLVETLRGSPLLPQPASRVSVIIAAITAVSKLFLFILCTPFTKFFLQTSFYYGFSLPPFRKGYHRVSVKTL